MREARKSGKTAARVKPKPKPKAKTKPKPRQRSKPRARTRRPKAEPMPEQTPVQTPEEAQAQEERERQLLERRMLRPGGCRIYMRNQLAKQFPEIVDGFVGAAKTGSVPHVKLATELLKPTRKGTTRSRKGTVAELLEKLERNKVEGAEEESRRWASPADEIRRGGVWSEDVVQG